MDGCTRTYMFPSTNSQESASAIRWFPTLARARGILEVSNFDHVLNRLMNGYITSVVSGRKHTMLFRPLYTYLASTGRHLIFCSGMKSACEPGARKVVRRDSMTKGELCILCRTRRRHRRRHSRLDYTTISSFHPPM
jgi:hypothetical protein